MRGLCHNAATVRRVAVIFVFIAATVGLAACGKGNLRSHSASTRAKAGFSSVSRGGRAASRPQASALAKALNLRASDLPGFGSNAQGKHPTATEAALERTLRACMGGAGSDTLAEASSAAFQDRSQGVHLSVSSTVTVAKSTARAQAQLRAMRSNQARGCLRSFVGKLLGAQSRSGAATAKLVSIAKGDPSAPGTSGGFGWRITGGFVAGAVRVPFFIDLLGFVYGQANVTLLNVGLPIPFPAVAERQLFALLLARAKTGGGGTLGPLGKGPSFSGPRQEQISL